MLYDGSSLHLSLSRSYYLFYSRSRYVMKCDVYALFMAYYAIDIDLVKE